jgi:beta-phosphoglucomutase
VIEGVLFDLDGVIVDTLHYHYLAWQHMFEKEGGSVREHTVLLHEGRNSREILPILMKESGVNIPEDRQDQFIENKRAYYRSIVEVKQYPNAFTVIETLRSRGYRIALVTACALENMKHSINSEQQRYFDFILTGDEVPRAKPFADPYLTAAGRLRIAPEKCLVVENAPLGIEAAKNAGMYCAAIETTLGKEYLSSADCILQSIDELLTHPLLQPLCEDGSPEPSENEA